MAIQLGLSSCMNEGSVTPSNDLTASNGMKRATTIPNINHSKAIGGGLRLGNHETDDMKKVQDEANNKLYEVGWTNLLLNCKWIMLNVI